MFDDTQIQSYQRITAPADLKQRVMDACENATNTSKPLFRKTVYRFTPMVACMLLLFSILWLHHEPAFVLSANGTPLSQDAVILPDAATHSVAMARSYSPIPAQYTVTLSGDHQMEILSVDGSASLSDNGEIIWTVEIPNQDMVFELFLLVGDVTYYVPLQYHVQDGSFSIRFETN